MIRSEKASRGPQAPPVRRSSPKSPTPMRMLARGSTMTRVDWEATMGPAWNAFWVRKRASTPKTMRAYVCPCR